MFVQPKGDKGFYINIPNSKQSSSYKKRLEEFRFILNKASKEYSIDSLKLINTDQLITSRDIAITITNNILEQFGDRIQPPKKGQYTEEVSTALYKDISSFLLTSTMVKELNTILKPYSIAVDRIRLEKVHFVFKDNILVNGTVSQESNQIPDHILNFTSKLYVKRISK